MDKKLKAAMAESIKTQMGMVEVSFDYNHAGDAFEAIKEQMPRLGLYVYESPDFVGTSTYGLIISKYPLTPEHLKKISKGFRTQEVA